MSNKVFCIGLSKTGTTSLSRALEILGYKVSHFPFSIMKYRNGRLEFNHQAGEKYDALADVPTARFFRELDKEFPRAKFVYTTRDIDRWLDSCQRHFWPGQIFKGKNWINQLHYDMYGDIDYNEEKFRQGYRYHDQEVREYFKDRPDDILILDITKGDGWQRLCQFLGFEVKSGLFPKKDCIYTNIFKVFNIQRFRRFD